MNPVSFEEQTHVIAENQPEYLPLPAHITQDGQVISCWRLTRRERIKIFLLGRLWLSVLTFRHPLQPLHPTTDYPFQKTKQTK